MNRETTCSIQATHSMHSMTKHPRRYRPRGRLAGRIGFGLLALALLASAPARAAGLLVAEGPFGGALAIEEHSAEVTVNNGIAVTRVTQVFRNTENRVVEALYTFSVPEGASVANFSMWIDGKEMVGEVVEKERARQIYDSYKRVRRDPGLLEQTDYKTFEMRIFPIAAGAQQRVEITYYQELSTDGNWATYVYPLATVTRPGIDARVHGRFALSFDARSEVPITALESPSHGQRFAVVRHGAHYQQASLETAGGELSRDLVIAMKLERPRTGFDLIATRQRGEDGYFLLTLTVGEELAKAERGMDYVFVLDASGSMDQDGKLALSRDSVGAFIRELGEEDRFEVMSFNLAPTTLFNQLTRADDGVRSRALEFLGSREARGGTFLRPALETAYRYQDPDRPLNVVILSDGMTEQQERGELGRLIARRPSGVRVFAIGVGNEVNRPLLEQIAHQAGGLAAFISPEDDFERQARAFRRKLLRPAAANSEITFAGGGVYDVEPTRLPDLFHGSPLRLYGRYREGGEVEVRFKAAVGGEWLERTVQMELPEREAANPEIERMWAWHRVDRLLKEADRAGSRSPVVDEIVRLGEAYSIVTEHTSFLVLENDAEYRRWKIDRRNALRIERDRAAQARVRRELESLRAEALADLGPTQEKRQELRDQSEVVPGTTAPDARRSLPASTSPSATPTTAPSSPTQPRRGWDVDLGGGGGNGGGAVDPGSLALALGLAGLALARRRRAGR